MTDFTHYVERDAYADVLDLQLSDADAQIGVDPRGYSPAVAEEHGNGYMDDKILLGGSLEELDDVGEHLLHEPYDALPDLLDAAYETDLPRYATVDEPVLLQIHVSYNAEEQEFVFETDPQYNETLQGLTAVERVRTAIQELDAERLGDEGSMSELAAEAAGLREQFGPLRDVDTSFVSDAQTTTTDFSFRTGDGGSGYVFAANPPIIITERGASLPVPHRFGSREYGLVQDSETVLQTLHDAGYISIDSSAVQETIYNIGEQVLDETLEGVEFFRAMAERDTPPAYDTLHEFMVETDITLRRPEDRVKLDYLEGRSSTAEDVITRMTERYDTIIADTSEPETEKEPDVNLEEWLLPPQPFGGTYIDETTQQIQNHLKDVSLQR